MTGSLRPVLSLFPCSIKVGCLAVVRVRQLIVKYVTIISTVSNIQSRALPMRQMLLLASMFVSLERLQAHENTLRMASPR